jgi:hypothetical protein
MIDQLINQFYYIFVKPKDEDRVQNKYNPKCVTGLLSKLACRREGRIN